MGIATLLQAQTIDLSAADCSLIVPSGFVLLCERRGVGKHFWEDRALTRAFPWAGRMNAVCVGNAVEVQAGKEEKESGVVSHPLSFELWGFARNSNVIFCKSTLILARVK